MTLYYFLRTTWARGGEGRSVTPQRVPESPALRRNAEGAEPARDGCLEPAYATTRWSDVHRPLTSDTNVKAHWMEREFDDHVHSTVGIALSALLKGCAGAAAHEAPRHTPFNASKSPAFPIADYVDRIKKYVDLSSEMFIIACIYMDKLCLLGPEYAVSQLNVHRMMLTCCMLAHKYYDACPTTNHLLAKVGGIEPAEIDALEIHVLQKLQYNLEVSLESFAHYRRQMSRGAIARGMMSEDQANHTSSPTWEPRSKSRVDSGPPNADYTTGVRRLFGGWM